MRHIRRVSAPRPAQDSQAGWIFILDVILAVLALVERRKFE